MRLDEQGVTNLGIIEDENGLHLNAKDPDNIALEFFYMPPRAERRRIEAGAPGPEQPLIDLGLYRRVRPHVAETLPDDGNTRPPSASAWL